MLSPCSEPFKHFPCTPNTAWWETLASAASWPHPRDWCPLHIPARSTRPALPPPAQEASAHASDAGSDMASLGKASPEPPRLSWRGCCSQGTSFFPITPCACLLIVRPLQVGTMSTSSFFVGLFFLKNEMHTIKRTNLSAQLGES